MDFYNQLLAQKLSGGGGGGDKYAAFKALVDDSLTEVTAEMLDGITKISSYAFYECANLTSIEIPGSVKSIGGDYALSKCTSLSSVTISDGVTSIGNLAFAECRSLIHLTIPDSVTSIGISAFQNYANTWESLTFLSVVPPNCSQYFINSPVDHLTIYVPAESIDAYKSATGFSLYANKIQAIPSG